MMIFKYLYTVDLDSPHTRASSMLSEADYLMVVNLVNRLKND